MQSSRDCHQKEEAKISVELRTVLILIRSRREGLTARIGTIQLLHRSVPTNRLVMVATMLPAITSSTRAPRSLEAVSAIAASTMFTHIRPVHT